jgi:CRP-like cAMP-binding protein
VLLPQQGRAMQQKLSISTKNRILSRLSAADFALLQPHLEPIELPLRHILEVPKKSISHGYFIEYGLASIVAANKHKRLEVGLIGCEGMTGIPIVLGNDSSPNETFIQVAGNGMRIAADKLRKAILQSRSLERALLSFAHAFMNQTASTALSNGTATLEERLARWLLMANDRLRGDEVPLTHEFLSLMLGVRRAGVTVALHYLEQRALIRLARKQIMITDRKGLEAAANGTYYKPEKHHSSVSAWAGEALFAQRRWRAGLSPN